MKKRGLQIATLIAAATLISACNFFNVKDSASYAQHERCAGIKRQMAFNHLDNNVQASYQAPSQIAALKEQYKTNNCG